MILNREILNLNSFFVTHDKLYVEDQRDKNSHNIPKEQSKNIMKILCFNNKSALKNKQINRTDDIKKTNA